MLKPPSTDTTTTIATTLENDSPSDSRRTIGDINDDGTLNNNNKRTENKRILRKNDCILQNAFHNSAFESEIDIPDNGQHRNEGVEIATEVKELLPMTAVSKRTPHLHNNNDNRNHLVGMTSPKNSTKFVVGHDERINKSGNHAKQVDTTSNSNSSDTTTSRTLSKTSMKSPPTAMVRVSVIETIFTDAENNSPKTIAKMNGHHLHGVHNQTPPVSKKTKKALRMISSPPVMRKISGGSNGMVAPMENGMELPVERSYSPVEHRRKLSNNHLYVPHAES